MSIQVEHEDMEELRKWGLGLDRLQESCIECNRKTRFWHTPSNQPVCPTCALVLKDTDKRLRATGAPQ